MINDLKIVRIIPVRERDDSYTARLQNVGFHDCTGSTNITSARDLESAKTVPKSFPHEIGSSLAVRFQASQRSARNEVHILKFSLGSETPTFRFVERSAFDVLVEG